MWQMGLNIPFSDSECENSYEINQNPIKNMLQLKWHLWLFWERCAHGSAMSVLGLRSEKQKGRDLCHVHPCSWDWYWGWDSVGGNTGLSGWDRDERIRSSSRPFCIGLHWWKDPEAKSNVSINHHKGSSLTFTTNMWFNERVETKDRHDLRVLFVQILEAVILTNETKHM